MLKQWIKWLSSITGFSTPSGTKGVFITCNDIYVPKAIVAIRCFLSKNPGFSAYIIGSDISEKSSWICSEHNIKTYVVDLLLDFPYLQDRPYGQEYPIECFYHFYAYKLLHQHEHIVHIEPDVFTHKNLMIDWEAIDFIGGSHLPEFTISKFPAIMNDKYRLESEFGVLEYEHPRIFGGLRVYNCRNLKKVEFYEKIKQIYKRSWMAGCPRCGDDSLSALYQTIYPEHFTLLPGNVNVTFPKKFKSEDYHRIMHFHFGGVSPKWWSLDPQPTELGGWYRNRFIEFTYNNFAPEFIEQHLPEIYYDYGNPRIFGATQN